MATGSSFKLNDGNAIPAIGLGTWKSRKGEVKEAVEVAISCGYRHIDGAAAYLNEEDVGQGIKTKIEDGTVTRQELFVTTKLWNSWHNPDKVEEAARTSLRKLNLEYIDLYLMHWPIAFKFTGDENLSVKDESGKTAGEDVDYVDTWKAVEQLVRKGLAKSIGVSNFNKEQMERVLAAATIKPVTNQIECTPYLTNERLSAFCKEHNVVVTAYAPLGSIDNTEIRSRSVDEFPLNDPLLKQIGANYSKTPAQVALRWGVQRGTVVIPKSVTPSRIRENFQIFDFTLTKEEMAAVSDLNKNFRACRIEG